MKMTETKVGYQAVFYSGEKRITVSEIKMTPEEAEAFIENEIETHKVFNYNPWTHTEVEEVKFRVRKP
jgi:hypothetical protein